MLHFRELLADAFYKSQSALFDALISAWAEGACAAVHTPCAGHREDRAGVGGLQPRSNSSKTSHFLSSLPFPLLFSVLPPFDLILMEKSVTSAHYCY